MAELLNDLIFIFQRLDWLSVLDILLVTLIFFGLLYTLRDTQAMALLRGILLLVMLVALLTSLVSLPAFSWLLTTTLPALLFAIPVIFAPEIRRTLERIGRAGIIVPSAGKSESKAVNETVHAVVSAAARLSARQHGALIIFQRLDNLE